MAQVMFFLHTQQHVAMAARTRRLSSILFALLFSAISVGLLASGVKYIGKDGSKLHGYFMVMGATLWAILALLNCLQTRDSLTRAIGRRPTFPHQPFSSNGVSKAAAFEPRVSDVYILTPPKVGTTWMQMLCHALRTNGQHLQFEDIYQVVPWDQMAWDLGQDLDSEQVAFPRLFKTHQRLSSINRGAKYLCLIRSVDEVALSWWHFLQPKNIPPLQRYHSASEFVFDKDFFAGGMRFGASIWEYYTEFAKAMHLPCVLVLCYEDLLGDLQSHLPVLAQFLG